MVFCGARSERNVENCAGLACWVLIDLMFDFFATGRARKGNTVRLFYGAVRMKAGANPSEDFYANLARHLQAAVIYT
jgi:hypothetical protein